MTRKPMLPAIHDQLAVPLLRYEYSPAQALTELRAVEAVLRAARRELRAYDGEGADEQWDSAEGLRNALARLDRVTGRKP